MTRRRYKLRDGRGFERVEDEDLYEVVAEDEEGVESEEEVVLEDEVVVEESGEVVGRPRGDPVLEYAYGLTSELPSGLGEWQFPWLLSEYNKAETRGDAKLARRWARLVFEFCPARPRACPVYALTVSKCPYGLERRCRGFARAEERRAERPRKWRGWYREGGSGGR
jgi:hypothetical protein